jgi:serine/threonine-protein kinase
MALASVAELVEFLGRSFLLERPQHEEVARLQDRFPDARELGRELLRRDWLTPFQVNQLAAGRGTELLVGPYLLLERLGEGGTGQVYKARHRALHRVVALKVLRKEYLEHPHAIRRFLREVQAVAQLEHPNIVHAFDAAEAGGTYYLATEYVAGPDLDRLVRQEGPMPVAPACDFVRQAALGLQHIHEHGLVHRDLKPSNLLVAPPGREPPPGSGCLGRWGTVKILDLGLARLQERDEHSAATLLTQLGSLMGTPDFIAPEQARDCHTSDIRADLYSLGCTFYFLLSGQVPFPRGTIPEKLLQHQLDAAEPVEEVRRARLPAADARADLPAPVAALVRKLMAKGPEERPQRPAEVADFLTALLRKVRVSGPFRRRPVGLPPAGAAEVTEIVPAPLPIEPEPPA